LSALVVRWLWNVLARDFPRLPRLTYGKALAVTGLWGLLFLVVLTMIAATRELMTPGAWQKTGLLYQVAAGPPAPADTHRTEDRRRKLEQLQAALWDYAARHGGRLPPAGDPAIPAAAWEVPGGAGMRYLRAAARAIGDSPAPVAYEPALFGDRRFVLRASGQIELVSTAELHQQLQAGQEP